MDNILIPTHGLTIDKVEVVLVEEPPNKLFVIIKSIFDFFKLLYFSL